MTGVATAVTIEIAEQAGRDAIDRKQQLVHPKGAHLLFHILHSLSRIFHPQPYLFAAILAVALIFGIQDARAAVLSGDGYTVEYDSRDEREAKLVSDVATRTLPNLKLRFGPNPVRPVRIVVADSMDAFRDTVGSDVPEWAAGVAVASRNLVVLKPRRLTYRRGTTLEQTVRHELTHVVAGANYAMGRLPRWLNEGIAMWQADEPTFRGDFSLAASALFGRLVPESELDREFRNARNDVAAICYGESRSLVDFIIDQHGEAALMRILEESRTATANEAFISALGRPANQLYKEWRRWMQRYVYWYSVLSGVALFWFTALLVFVAYARKRIWGRRKLAEWDEEDGTTPLDLPS